VTRDVIKKPPSRKVGGNALDGIASKIRTLEKNNVANIIAIGELLEEAAGLIPHGEYATWLKASFGWSSKTAYRYRNVFNLSESCQIDNFVDIEVDLNISISALYLLAELNLADSKAKAVIAAAKRHRVTYLMAKQIIADSEKHEAETAAEGSAPVPTLVSSVESPTTTRTVEVEISHSSIPLAAPATPLPGRTIPLSPKPAPPPAADTTKKPSAPVVETAPRDERDHDDLARMLRGLHLRLYDSGTDLEKAVAEVGAGTIHEIIGRLKSALDKHNASSAIKEKADRAEAGKKPKLDKTTIREMTDRAEARSKISAPADYPDIPPGLDRRAKPIEKLDETAAEIAAKATHEKQWLN
jgi:hypothetical protein